MENPSSQKESPVNISERPLLIILSGPSGVGKDAVLNQFKNSQYPIRYITTLTTRPKRPNEIDHVDYHFISTEEFRRMKKDGELLESARVYDNYYGVPKSAVTQALERGEDTIIKVDIQGAKTIKTIVPTAVFIFLMPPSLGALERRLKQRYTESPVQLALRLKKAEEEITQVSLFDYVVVNQRGKISRAVSDIKAIITAEKCGVTGRKIVIG